MSRSAKTGFFIMLLIYAAFIALGMPDGLIGVAWPSMQKDFKLPIDAIGLSMITATAYISINKIVLISLISALCGSALLWLNITTALSLAGVILSGFAIAPIFPSLVSGTSARVGDKHTGNTIGMQMAASGLGMAGMPALVGVIARRTSLEAIPPVLCAMFAVIIILYIAAIGRQEN
jgi:fucose permease